MVWLGAGWIALAGCAAAIRMSVAATPVHHPLDALPMLLAYSAIIAAPISGYLLARSAFGDERARQPLDFHLAFIGKWERVSRDDARAHPLFGPVGFLASLLVGLILNVLVRSGEFFVAVPAISMHAPDWALALFVMMSADVIIMNFFYMVAFVMALRSIPLFPRMLLFAWLTDIVMQLAIASQLGKLASMPAEVAAPLAALLEGNLTKVWISIAVWLPYLLLSDRVNITYRSRLPA
ncbi:DUF2569 domain-containing protein [Erythrobacter sp. sf7]|uniref:DUF2569 domain-containing protein n=1 Tax=Erythrobacter fulvus TaxID=2987523 RepID=A0ABT5JQC1_9SPHN|nr:DUF2569 domain-containing protein [Erythrobacter fulvus]MDC8754804.1 DUF2569 domain-containing protein [Erythrobacter fulvus]